MPTQISHTLSHTHTYTYTLTYTHSHSHSCARQAANLSAYKAAFAQANNSLTHTAREPQVREGERESQSVSKSGGNRERAQLCAYLSCHNNCLNALAERIRRKRRSRSSYYFRYTHTQTNLSNALRTELSRAEPIWAESYLCVAQQCAFATNWQSRCKIMKKRETKSRGYWD